MQTLSTVLRLAFCLGLMAYLGLAIRRALRTGVADAADVLQRRRDRAMAFTGVILVQGLWASAFATGIIVSFVGKHGGRGV